MVISGSFMGGDPDDAFAVIRISYPARLIIPSFGSMRKGDGQDVTGVGVIKRE
jgi:hypothetical protein